jgi:hypothetical protein
MCTLCSDGLYRVIHLKSYLNRARIFGHCAGLSAMHSHCIDSCLSHSVSCGDVWLELHLKVTVIGKLVVAALHVLELIYLLEGWNPQSSSHSRRAERDHWKLSLRNLAFCFRVDLHEGNNWIERRGATSARPGQQWIHLNDLWQDHFTEWIDEAVARLTCIQKVIDSNLGRDITCSEVFHGFS